MEEGCDEKGNSVKVEGDEAKSNKDDKQWAY